MSKKIDINKTYRTRDGHEIRLYATDAGGEYPIHGSVFSDGKWRVDAWTADGAFNRIDYESEFDLIEVKPRHKRTVWLNVFSDNKLATFASKTDADYFTHLRIACVKVELDFEEGEGL